MKRCIILLFLVAFMATVINISAVAETKEPTITYRDHLANSRIPEIKEQAIETGLVSSYINIPNYNTSREWTIPPVIFKTNDAVKPGGIFYIYGDGMLRRDMKIALRIADKNIPNTKPSADCITIMPLMVDNQSKYVAAKLPEDITAGVYDVWVSNKYGWSAPTRLNAAKPEWFSNNEAAQGMICTVYGKNFDGTEFNTSQKAKIALISGDKSYEVPIVSVNPFRIEFYVPDNVPEGKYTLYASNNDGIVWTKLAWDDSLTVYTRTQDPINLGVAWARVFKWDKRFNVKDYGAIGDGKSDDSLSIQKTIDVAKENGGGVVYMPNGNYKILSGLLVPADIVILGESKQKTRLIYAYNGSDANKKIVINGKDDQLIDGRVGFAKFTITFDASIGLNYPDCVFELGNQWGAQKQEGGRTAKYMFIKDFAMDYSMLRGTGRANGVRVVGDGYFLCSESDFKGHSASIVFSYIDNFIVKNCDWHTTVTNLGVVGLFSEVVNNYIKRYKTEFDPIGIETQGVFTRGPLYASENYIENTGFPKWNDGEVICTEYAGGGTAIYGIAVSATENTVKVVPKNTNSKWNLVNPLWGDRYLAVVIGGRGQGQYAFVTSADEKTGTLTLDRRWNVLPDSSSIIQVMIPTLYPTIYKNTAYKGAKGFWLYGDVVDGVIADNVGTNIEGAAVYTLYAGYGRLAIGYYNRLTRNSFTGSSIKTNVCGVSINANIETEPEPIAIVYGGEIRDNTVKGANGKYILDSSEAPDMNGINMTHNVATPSSKMYDMSKALLIENNVVSDSTNGLNLGGYAFEGRADWTENGKAPATVGVIVKGNNVEKNTLPIRTNGVNRLLFVK